MRLHCLATLYRLSTAAMLTSGHLARGITVRHQDCAHEPLLRVARRQCSGRHIPTMIDIRQDHAAAEGPALLQSQFAGSFQQHPQATTACAEVADSANAEPSSLPFAYCSQLHHLEQLVAALQARSKPAGNSNSTSLDSFSKTSHPCSVK